MHLMEGEAIIFEVVRVTSHGRMAHVSELALIVMDAEVKQLCWDCRVEHKAAVEEFGRAHGSGRGQPVSYEDKLNSRRTLRASESCTYVAHVAGCDRSGYCWLPRPLGERCTDLTRQPQTPGNGYPGVGGRVGLFVSKVMILILIRLKTQLWRFDCSEKVGEVEVGCTVRRTRHESDVLLLEESRWWKW